MMYRYLSCHNFKSKVSIPIKSPKVIFMEKGCFTNIYDTIISKKYWMIKNVGLFNFPFNTLNSRTVNNFYVAKIIMFRMRSRRSNFTCHEIICVNFHTFIVKKGYDRDLCNNKLNNCVPYNIYICSIFGLE